jgi:hypothetical protein
VLGGGRRVVLTCRLAILTLKRGGRGKVNRASGTIEGASAWEATGQNRATGNGGGSSVGAGGWGMEEGGASPPRRRTRGAASRYTTFCRAAPHPHIHTIAPYSSFPCPLQLLQIKGGGVHSFIRKATMPSPPTCPRQCRWGRVSGSGACRIAAGAHVYCVRAQPPLCCPSLPLALSG